jgi:hypothetical protein
MNRSNTLKIAAYQLIVLVLSLLSYAVYLDYIQPRYAYMGFYTADVSYYVVFIHSVLVSFGVVFLPKNIKLPSDFLVIFLYVFVVIPSFTVPLYTASELEYSVYLSFLCMGFFIFILLSRLSSLQVYKVKPKFIGVGFNYPVFVALILLAAGCVVVFSGYGFNVGRLFRLDSMAGLYDIRSEFRVANVEGSNFAGYALPWLSKALVPFLLALALSRRSYLLVLLLVGVQFLLFSTSGHKSIFMGLFVVPLVFYFANIRFGGERFFLLLTALLILSVLAFYVVDFEFLLDVFMRRVFVVPGLLTGYYLEHYSMNAFEGYSILNAFTNLQANDVKAAFEIGEVYMGRQSLSANANFFAAAYAGLGLVGVLYEGAILLLFMFFLNWIVMYRDRQVALASTALALTALFDTRLFTVLLTHGAFISLLIALFLVRARNEYQD